MNCNPKRTQAISIGWLAGVVSFFASMLFGFLGLRYVIRLQFPDKHYTEAYEGAGEAIFVGYIFLFAMGIWLVVTLLIAVSIGYWFVRRILK
jgi:hypothetical protein